MVQQLLGHASRDTTVDRYLAPVADLNLRSMLAGAAGADRGPDARAGRGVRPGSAGVGGHPGCGRHRPVPGRRLVSGRGRRAALPAGGHARPEYLVADGQGGLVVRHHNREGRVREYDFAQLPVPAPMRASLAALFAARCTPDRWSAHGRRSSRGFSCGGSRSSWPARSRRRVTWTSSPRRWCGDGGHGCRRAPEAITPSAWSAACCSTTPGFRRDRSPTSWPAARRKPPEQAPVLQRGGVRPGHGSRPPPVPGRPAAHQRQRRCTCGSGGTARSPRAAASGRRRRAGHPGPHRGPAQERRARTGSRATSVARYRNALGPVAWQRLFLTREEAVALGVLLLAEFGWNLSVISSLEVPMASPDQGEDGHPTYRIPLEKPRRGPGRHHETRNVTDHGAGSPGRLITQALEATRFARAIVAELAPGTARLIVWRAANPGGPAAGPGRHRAVGPFRFGITAEAAKDWAKAEGLEGSPFRRGRRTVIALDRREPGQHSQDTHDRHYVLPDERVRAEAVEVIAAGAEDAAGRARKAVLAAELRDQPDPGDAETATAACSGTRDSPWPAAGRRLRRLVPDVPGLPERPGSPRPPSPPRSPARGPGQPAVRPAARRLGGGLARRPRPPRRPEGAGRPTGPGPRPWPRSPTPTARSSATCSPGTSTHDHRPGLRSLPAPAAHAGKPRRRAAPGQLPARPPQRPLRRPGLAAGPADRQPQRQEAEHLLGAVARRVPRRDAAGGLEPDQRPAPAHVPARAQPQDARPPQHGGGQQHAGAVEAARGMARGEGESAASPTATQASCTTTASISATPARAGSAS